MVKTGVGRLGKNYSRDKVSEGHLLYLLIQNLRDETNYKDGIVQMSQELALEVAGRLEGVLIRSYTGKDIE